MSKGYACGKVILFGEHAVVYGRPAIAAPVTDVRAEVEVREAVKGAGIVIHAVDLGRAIDLASAPADEPLSLTVRNTLAHIGCDAAGVHLVLTINSSIPIASGLGSGAAAAAAIMRALCAHFGHAYDAATVSAIVYETEKIHHGTPSGIDNTVVAFEQPVYFVQGREMEILAVKRPFWLAIADTGLPSLTKESVADVRAAWQRAPVVYDHIFDRIGDLTDRARQAIEKGDVGALGPLMNENQRLLRRLDVSLPELERLIDAALQTGASGAKLSGGGRGGNMIALIAPQNIERAKRALVAAGAKNVIVTHLG